MKILYIVKSEPSGLVKTLIDNHSKGNDVKVINLSKKEAAYETIIDEIAASDKVISW
jgi:hypothetical protein